MKAQYWLILSAVVLGGFVLLKKADSASYEKLSKSAAQAWDAANSYADELKARENVKNLDIIRVEGHPHGYPKAYAVTWGNSTNKTTRTFPVTY